MTDNRQKSELYERRQVCARIKELKSNCEELTQTKNNLLIRLKELNEITDRLIEGNRNTELSPYLDTRVEASESGPSTAFKCKLAHYLGEIMQKAEELSVMSQHLHNP